MKTKKTSKLPQFYKRTINERQTIVAQWIGESNQLTPERLDLEKANNMIENVIETYELPLGIATNFLINNKDYLIPMVIEEPSVIAAVSNAAKMFRSGGGFNTSSDEPIMIGQIQLTNVRNPEQTLLRIQENKELLLKTANEVGGSIIDRGGGAKDIKVRIFHSTPIGHMVVIHLLYDTRDAMGANIINTAVEHIAPTIESITNTKVNLRILSNLTDERKAYASGMIPHTELKHNNIDGKDVVNAIIEAGIFAEVDPYRAATHNKGILNGIDAVVLATGNDWRAVEAGAHAYAARSGHYTSLSKWWADEDGNLHGSIELPLAVGIVGGATRVHPKAQLALNILGVTSAQELSEIMAAVGLAQNLGALRALATEGIQRGHMRMHARQIAAAAGADSKQVPIIANILIQENTIRLERAKQLVQQMQEKD